MWDGSVLVFLLCCVCRSLIVNDFNGLCLAAICFPVNFHRSDRYRERTFFCRTELSCFGVGVISGNISVYNADAAA